MSQFPGHFNVAQTAQLLAPIKESRVLRDPRGNSHVSQQDVTAHLIRVFGFGNFGTELISIECLFETPREDNPRKYDVAYRAHMRLTIYDENHNFVTTYEDASTGDAQNQWRADAHDLAMKSAISLAKKRCCINLGDQFGLSLYNRGQLAALVGGTHVLPERPEGEGPKDLQDDVPQQVSMGVDEIEKTPEPSEDQQAQLASSLGATPVESHSPTAEEQAAMYAARAEDAAVEEPPADHTETVQS